MNSENARKIRIPKAYLKAAQSLYGAISEISSAEIPTKIKKAPRPRTCPKEDAEHMRCVQWLRIHNIPHHHSPNGGWRSVQAGAKFKALGTMAGWPDLEIPIPKHPFHGMFAEIKALDGKLSEAQKICLDMLRDNGYFVFVAYGYDKFVKMASDYLGIEK